MARTRITSRRKATSASVEPSNDYSSESNDFISDVPELVIDKILKRLPLGVAAMMGVLSRTWRRNWLSCKYVMFDDSFWTKFQKYEVCDWQKGSSAINNALCHHDGCIYSFQLELRPPGRIVQKNVSLSQWLSLLYRTCPKKIVLINLANVWSDVVGMPSYIFRCMEVTKLELMGFVLKPPPFDFKGFPYLNTLVLVNIVFRHGIDMLWSLVAKCPRLDCLKIEHVMGMYHLDVDAPTLKTLAVEGWFETITLKNCPRLVDVSLCSINSQLNETIAATVTRLATSYELQCLAIDGSLCKFLAACWVNKPLHLAFNYLNRLSLVELMLSDPDVFRFTIGMIQCCPFLKKLEISVSSCISIHQHTYEYNNGNYKLGMLDEVKITGITDSIAELKLIEYLLAVSVVLKKFFLKCFKGVSESEMTRKLMQVPRASPKAQFICLDK